MYKLFDVFMKLILIILFFGLTEKNCLTLIKKNLVNHI